jgi:hypothetical protein
MKILSALYLHLSGNHQTRIPGNRRRQVGEWLDKAYALLLQEETDSGNSTEERNSGKSTEEMDSSECANCEKWALARKKQRIA